MKNAILLCSSKIQNLEKDVIIRDLKRRIESNNEFSEHIINSLCVNRLRLVGDSKKEDSDLIYMALLQLHDARIDILKMKTLTGRSKSGQK